MNDNPNHLRFRISERLEHWVLVASFTTLGITGMVQSFASSGISQSFIGLLGGIESVRIIHRVAAFILMLESVYHVGVVGYKIIVRRSRLHMLPTMGDIRSAFQSLLYNLKLSTTKPQQGRYTFDEKIEYWAVIWGTLIMGITGFMMWNPIATTRLLPGDVIPAAKAAHSGEALLAILAVIVWHLYHVHLRHLNLSMFSGFLSEDEMLEEHPLELADLKAGIAELPIEPTAMARRRRFFLFGYAFVAAFMMIGIYFFVAYEESAIQTVPPPEQLVVYSPLTPTPIPTPIPSKPPPATAPATWDDGFALMFQERCGACHGGLGGLDLSTYQTTLEGGVSGPSVIAGDPETSLLVIRQSTGDHPGQLTGDELAQVREWIENGAPEN
jgi:cytochrome b subunit of formate dehydrogenase/mono/diheme cytochrome c family protein